MIELRELIVILDLHKEGLSVSAIAERTGLDRKTIGKYIARGVEPPQYGPRAPRPRIMDPYEAYVRERLAAFPELSIPRLLREIQEKPLAMIVEQQTKLTPWDTWPFFLLFLTVISVEWYLRKKWGLV